MMMQRLPAALIAVPSIATCSYQCVDVDECCRLFRRVLAVARPQRVGTRTGRASEGEGGGGGACHLQALIRHYCGAHPAPLTLCAPAGTSTRTKVTVEAASTPVTVTVTAGRGSEPRREEEELWADGAPCCTSYWATVTATDGVTATDDVTATDGTTAAGEHDLERLSLRARVLEPLLLSSEVSRGGGQCEVTLLSQCEVLRVLFAVTVSTSVSDPPPFRHTYLLCSHFVIIEFDVIMICDLLFFREIERRTAKACYRSCSIGPCDW
jgi:hypothetical protein